MGQVNETNEIISLNPQFSGTSISTVRLIEKVESPTSTALDGQVYSETELRNPEEFVYPFDFGLPDMSLHKIHFPVIKDVNLAAFAHELSIYADENVYKQI